MKKGNNSRNKSSNAKEEYFKKLNSLIKALPESDPLDVEHLVRRTAICFLDYSPNKDFFESKYINLMYLSIADIGIENIRPHKDLLIECTKSLLDMLDEKMK